MKSLSPLERPQFRGNQPVPFYGKLLLHNKILIVIALLLISFGLVGSGALYKILKAHFSGEFEANFRIMTRSLGHRITPLLLAGDSSAVARQLDEERQLCTEIVYLVVTDPSGNIISQARDKRPSDDGGPDSLDGQAAHDPAPKVPFLQAPVKEISVQVMFEERALGTIQAGLSTLPIQAFVRKIMTLYLLMVSLLGSISFLIARRFLRYATRPIVTLTRIADEISLGNLDMDIFFGEHVNCWEIKKCQREDCAAYKNVVTQCWFVDGTPCEGYEPTFPAKLKGCRNCEVYKTHKGDEIVQLADSFQHMIYMLKTSQEEINSSHKFQSNLIQNSLIGIIATDERGLVRIFNRVAESLTGYAETEVIGKLTIGTFFSKEVSTMINRPLIFDYGFELRGFKPMESEILSRNREPIPIRLSGISLYEDGKHAGKVFSFQDMREIKRLRQDLIQSERLTATGQAVASISHSIKNILDGLVGGVHVYKAGTRKHDEKGIQNGWRMIEKNIDLISELVINLLNYAKRREPIFQKCDPRTIVEDVAHTMQNKISDRKIEIRSHCEGDFGNIYLDSYALHQCLMNLVSNAIDAIPSERPGHITIKVESKNEHGIIFEVCDNGIGMSEEIKEKAFQGMFSTKGSKGTGLGLLVIKKIVSELTGTLDVVSEENQGTIFRIWLPHHTPAATDNCSLSVIAPRAN